MLAPHGHRALSPARAAPVLQSRGAAASAAFLRAGGSLRAAGGAREDAQFGRWEGGP